MAGAAFAVYYGFGNIAVSGSEIDETRLTQAQTAAFLTVMMVHIFYLLTSRSLTKSTFKMNPFSNKLVTVGISASISLHLIIVYALPRVGFNPLRVEPFPVEWWGIIVALGFLGLLLVEFEELAVDKLSKLFPRTLK